MWLLQHLVFLPQPPWEDDVTDASPPTSPTINPRTVSTGYFSHNTEVDKPTKVVRFRPGQYVFQSLILSTVLKNISPSCLKENMDFDTLNVTGCKIRLHKQGCRAGLSMIYTSRMEAWRWAEILSPLL